MRDRKKFTTSRNLQGYWRTTVSTASNSTTTGKVVGKATSWLSTDSWTTNGLYSSGRPSKELLSRLSRYALTQ